MKRLLMSVCVAILISTQVGADEVIKDPWSDFKEGSWVKIKNTTKMGDMQQEEQTLTQTLIRKTEDEVVLKQETGTSDQILGKTEDQKLEKEVSIPLKPKTKGKGEETIEVAGKKWKCAVVEIEDAGTTVTSWVCKEGPCEKVLMKSETVTNAGGVKTTSTMTAVKLGEELAIGAKKVKCIVYEVKSGQASGKVWISFDVPGFQVKAEMTISTPAMKIETISEVVDFEVKK